MLKYIFLLRIHSFLRSCSFVSDSLRPYGLQPTRLLCPWESLGKNTEVGHHFLLQGIFLTRGPNPCLLHLLHWQVDSLPVSHQGSPIHSSLYHVLCLSLNHFAAHVSMSILQYPFFFFFCKFFKKIFLVWTIFKVFIEFVTILLLFYVLVFIFGPEAWGFLVHLPGIKPTPPALEGEVLTTGPSGKSLFASLKYKTNRCSC